jgi:hypothetical protein
MDVWTNTAERKTFTHYAKKSAACFGKTYMSAKSISKKEGVETVMAAFTDHLAACVRINLGDTRGHIVDKAYENLTVNCWEMNNEPSVSVVNGCARRKCEGST